MINNEIIKKIEEFVYTKPRSIQEIAGLIKKNWRTADRYVEEIIKERGTLNKRVFREGTRGALKIIYWASVEKASSSVFQEDLEKEILGGKAKEDFSAFDIFQHVQDKYKKVRLEPSENENLTDIKELQRLLQKAKKQVLIFSGNVSFINLKNKECSIEETLEEIVSRNVKIKILARVDVAGSANIKKALSLNYKQGSELVEIRHRNQPLRAIIIDNTFFRLKEVREPTGRKNELAKKTYIFYTLKEKEWVEWASKIFWNMFSNSIGSKKRLEELDKLKQ